MCIFQEKNGVHGTLHWIYVPRIEIQGHFGPYLIFLYMSSHFSNGKNKFMRTTEVI